MSSLALDGCDSARKCDVVQILSNAVPGFRGLRGPLIAGYVWLLFAYLAATPDFDTRPEGAIGGALYDLRHDIGRVGVAVAISVAAYLVGAVSQELSQALRRTVQWLRPSSFYSYTARRGQIGSWEPMRAACRSAKDTVERAGEDRRVPDSQLPRLREMVDERFGTALEEAVREVMVPATLLAADRPELFAEVDRLRAEAELRHAVVPPLAAMAILLAVVQSAFWLAALPPIALLLIQGVRRETDSQRTVANAIQNKLIPSPSAERFEAWVEDLPQLIHRVSRTGWIPTEDRH